MGGETCSGGKRTLISYLKFRVSTKFVACQEREKEKTQRNYLLSSVRRCGSVCIDKW